MLLAIKLIYRQIKRIFNCIVGRDVMYRRQVKLNTKRLGGKDGVWCIYPEAINKDSIIYSLGVGEDISFDLELVKQFGITVHAFDPTPRSIEWVKTQNVPSEFVLHEFGVADFDGTATFYPPENTQHVSHTLIPMQDRKDNAIVVPVRRLQSLMKQLEHTHINLLKMDIEGAEYTVIPDLLTSGIKVDQLLVEYHHRWDNVGVRKTKDSVELLNKHGYRIFNVSATGEEYSFLYSPEPK